MWRNRTLPDTDLKPNDNSFVSKGNKIKKKQLFNEIEPILSNLNMKIYFLLLIIKLAISNQTTEFIKYN